MTRPWLVLCAGLFAACSGTEGDSGGGGAEQQANGERRYEPPVVTNAEAPVRYPPALFRNQVEGTVVLRLFVTQDGNLVADSTRIAESSGHAGLDSAAVAGADRMQFAPARRDGVPVASSFLQPVHFRHPSGASLQRQR